MSAAGAVESEEPHQRWNAAGSSWAPGASSVEEPQRVGLYSVKKERECVILPSL